MAIKRLIAISLAIVIGVFANITITIPVLAVTGDITIRPSAAGAVTNIEYNNGATNWQCVDEAVADEGVSEVYTTWGFYVQDLYTTENTTQTGTINYVQVFMRCYGSGGNARTSILVGSTSYNGSVESLGAAYATYNTTYTNNPNTGVAWTWANVNDLQIGLLLKSADEISSAHCTQVYAVVNYTTTIPTVSTQATTNITGTTAVGNGTITDTGGENATKRGICWNTAGTPTVADNKTEESGNYTTGAFTENITGLTPRTTYYARAYAYNSEGYGYGAQVSWVSAVTPNITSANATLITSTSARLKATLNDDGGEANTVAFGYGTTNLSADNFTSYDTVANVTGTWTTGQHPYLDVSGLTANTTYYYRARATNSCNFTVTTYEQTLTTVAILGTVANVTANPSNTSMYLRWTKASGSSNTSVQYRTDGYAATYTDPSNSMGYNGTARECTITGLVAGQTYYFSLWGFNDAGTYSTTPATILMTTLAAAVPSGGTTTPAVTLPTPTVPAGAASDPDISGFNMEPFTGIINYFNNGPGGFGMPNANAWEGLYIVVMVLVAGWVYVKWRNFLPAYAILFALTAAGWGLHIVQGYLLWGEVIIGMGYWAIDKYAQ